MEEEGERRAYKGTVGGGLESVGERAGHGVDAGVDIAAEKRCVARHRPLNTTFNPKFLRALWVLSLA